MLFRAASITYMHGAVYHMVLGKEGGRKIVRDGVKGDVIVSHGSVYVWQL